MSAWPEYLRDFHRRKAGITEDVLSRAYDATGQTPYGWLLSALPTVAEAPRVLDLACGSAPLLAALGGRSYVGVDRSPEELARAQARSPAGRFVLGDAAALPVGGPFDAVLCSMALMLMRPVEPVLAEVARVLRPGGRFVATVPADRPLSPRDRWHYARLLLGLRQAGLCYPERLDRSALATRLRDVSLRLCSDERRRFAVPLAGPGDARLLVDSLYLPDADPVRLRRAAAALAGSVRRWPLDLGIPIRRIVAVRQ